MLISSSETPIMKQQVIIFSEKLRQWSPKKTRYWILFMMMIKGGAAPLRQWRSHLVRPENYSEIES